MFKFQVSLPLSIDQEFTYCSEYDIKIGCRVVVPFGEKNRRLIGIVVGRTVDGANLPPVLKKIEEQVDQEPTFSAELLSLAKWMSQYYIFSFGEVIRTMLPASQKKTKGTSVELTALGSEILQDKEHSLASVLQGVWKRGTPVDLKTVKRRLKTLSVSLPKEITLNSLTKMGLVKSFSRNKVSARTWIETSVVQESAAHEEPRKELTPAQTAVLDRIQKEGHFQDESPPFKSFLLHGITGAGKTEIYLQAIARLFCFNSSAQVLVLVPEISLTPQMTRVFSARFPGQVAVVHSALTDKARWEQLSSVKDARKSILIGPRSAVFAPFRNLRLIVVDEEHDSSYKQGSGLSYNARDVAVMRSQIESCSVILGSATPSMESFFNATSGRYTYLELRERPFGREMPEVELIQPSISFQYAKKINRWALEPKYLDLPIDEKVIEELRRNYSRGMQSMVLVNRRGYAYYLFSLKDKKAVSCRKCSISLTVHKKSTILKCHYCGFSADINSVLGSDSLENYALVGYGSEQVESYLKEVLPGARIARVDSDSVGQKDALAEILEDFRSEKIDVLVGTQMQAKGHDFAKVTLICILEIDQTLNLPDFRAGERAFQLMVQAAGRAGRGQHKGRVLIQTLKGDDPVIKAGLSQDYGQFWRDQAKFRQVCHYPPFSRMILFEFSSLDESHLIKFSGQVELWIKQAVDKLGQDFASLQILGPSIPPLYQIRGRYRRTLLLVGDTRKQLWSFASQLKAAFRDYPGDLTLRIDVDPQSLI